MTFKEAKEMLKNRGYALEKVMGILCAQSEDFIGTSLYEAVCIVNTRGYRIYNPALKESAKQFNDALLDEQGKKIKKLKKVIKREKRERMYAQEKLSKAENEVKRLNELLASSNDELWALRVKLGEKICGKSDKDKKVDDDVVSGRDCACDDCGVAGVASDCDDILADCLLPLYGIKNGLNELFLELQKERIDEQADMLDDLQKERGRLLDRLSKAYEKIASLEREDRVKSSDSGADKSNDWKKMFEDEKKRRMQDKKRLDKECERLRGIIEGQKDLLDRYRTKDILKTDELKTLKEELSKHSDCNNNLRDGIKRNPSSNGDD